MIYSDRKVTVTASNSDLVQRLSNAKRPVLSERAFIGKLRELPVSVETLAWFRRMTDSHRRIYRNKEVRLAVNKWLTWVKNVTVAAEKMTVGIASGRSVRTRKLISQDVTARVNLTCVIPTPTTAANINSREMTGCE